MQDITSLINDSLRTKGVFHQEFDAVISGPVIQPAGTSFFGDGFSLTFEGDSSFTMQESNTISGKPSRLADFQFFGTGQQTGLEIQTNKFFIERGVVGNVDGFAASKRAYDFQRGIHFNVSEPINSPASIHSLVAANYGQIGIFVEKGNDLTFIDCKVMSGAIDGKVPLCPLLTWQGLTLSACHSWGNHQFGDTFLGDGSILNLCQHECANGPQLILSSSDNLITNGAVFLAPGCFPSWSKGEGIWLGLDDDQLAELKAAGMPLPADGSWGGGWVNGNSVTNIRVGRTSPAQMSFPTGRVMRISARAQRSEVHLRFPEPSGSAPVQTSAKSLFAVETELSSVDGTEVTVQPLQSASAPSASGFGEGAQ